MSTTEGKDHDNESHNHAQEQHNSHGTHPTQGHASNNDEMDDRRHSDARSTGTQGEAGHAAGGGRGSFKSEQHPTRQSQRQPEKRAERLSTSTDKRHSDQMKESDPQSHNVQFKNRDSSPQDANHLPPLPPGTKTKQSSDQPKENLARASWTTASFTEVPNALEELTEQQPQHQHHHHHRKTKEQSTGHVDSSSDLQSILLKHGKHKAGSILTKYLRPTMSDEGTQAGISSWDWLSRLEQMLIHFFLMVFESSNDSSKLIMEMMSTEAGLQVEEIFQLLLKAEPDMYKELGHLVTLAEKWLIHWRGDSEERLRALEYVRLYMQGVKDKNYYTLPVQVRLHKLGAFIAGLKVMGKDAPLKYPPVTFPSYKVHPPVPEIQFRVGSPRVKPATHFSQVVANILCARPCDDPFPKAEVYADRLGRNVFKNTLHGDKEFKTYTDQKYGRLYQKKELFFKENRRIDSLIDGAGDADVIESTLDRADCVQNLHCWIPKYTKSYVQTLQDNGCEVLAKADFEKSLKVKECRLGKDADEAACHAIKIVKPKKLYDWVRGADGKVHRRVVGSYTELGTAASMSKLMGTPDGRGGRKTHKHNEPGFHLGKKGAGGMRGGVRPKSASDTRINTRSYGTKKSHTTRTSKGRSANRSKERSGKDGRFKKPKTNNAGTTMNALKMDGISLEGSGDSGQDDSRTRKDPSNKKGATFGSGKYGQKGTSNNRRQMANNYASSRGGGRDNRTNNSRGYRDNARGDNRANSRDYSANSGDDRDNSRDYRGNNRDYRGNNRDNRGGNNRDNRGNNRDNSRGYKESGGARGGRLGDNPKDKGFVNIYNKNNQKFGSRQNKRSYKSYKRGLFSTRGGEWGGEDYPGWSPGGSDYSFERDENYRQSNLQLLSLNQCWEKASKLFKKPSKALVIPPAENLMLYLEKKYTKSRWSKGNPIATRNYPNGTTFVAQYGNGSSKVFYPHGGLAVAISAPSPVTSQVLVVRDPSDHVFFFDKALLAEMNSAGNGIIYGEDGIIKAQYSPIGGFKLDNLEKGQRWQWNHGGQRMLMKLNKFMSLRISDHDKIFLNFFGNHRGFLVNVASGQEVVLVNPNAQTSRVDPLMHELRNLIRPKTKDDNFDYIRGKFNSRPTLGFVDKAKHYMNSNDMEMPETYNNLQGDSSPDAYFVKLMSRTLSRGNNNDGYGVTRDDFKSCTNVYRDKNALHIHTLPVCCTYNNTVKVE